MNYHTKFSFLSFLILFGIFLFHHCSFAQANYCSFCEQSIKTTNTGMIILGVWATANLAIGAYGWSIYSGQQKYFNQMNFFWNTVNLTIAGIALYNNNDIDCRALTPDNILSRNEDTERILLINAALDIGYIGIGLLLRHFSKNSTLRGDLLKGYGNSLVLQGTFLFVFDLCLYGILRNQTLNFLSTIDISIGADMKSFHLILNL